MASNVRYWRVPQIVVDLDSSLSVREGGETPPDTGEKDLVYDKAVVRIVGDLDALGIGTDGLAEEVREAVDSIIRKRETK